MSRKCDKKLLLSHLICMFVWTTSLYLSVVNCRWGLKRREPGKIYRMCPSWPLQMPAWAWKSTVCVWQGEYSSQIDTLLKPWLLLWNPQLARKTIISPILSYPMSPGISQNNLKVATVLTGWFQISSLLSLTWLLCLQGFQKTSSKWPRWQQVDSRSPYSRQ